MHTPLLFLGDIGGSEMLLIMVVILVFFGANKIPELARGLGKGIREFKDASREIRSEFENHVESQQQQPYQQQFNQNYIAPSTPTPAPEQLPDDAYTQTEPTYSSPSTSYSAPVTHTSSADQTVPAPTSAERPRLDQMS
ncbi:Sec-independent protein translocase subunit TatA/TatB [Hymenobacter volaticus]|uniref:Sec-independent protein translocase subunit TatA/TatB n=1 Tax=Hymenobacter volaticus TaxID=2932254 RepID=UPI00288046B4|nr:twin-arginine translocase TatA/TatE family subunit [Hymenobacter volaticus]